MDHGERGCGEGLDHEVAVAHRVDGVAGDAAEAQLVRDGLPVEAIPGTRERARAERGDVRAARGVREPTAVPLRHLHVRQQVMREQDGLGRLDVGVPGHDHVPMAPRKVDEGALEPQERLVQVTDPPTQPEPQVRRHLVVARAAGVELAGDRTDAGRERHLEVEMDILERGIPGDGAGLDLPLETVESLDERTCLVGGQEPGALEAADMRDGAAQVVDEPARHRPRWNDRTRPPAHRAPR